jgi:hypothetical protein
MNEYVVLATQWMNPSDPDSEICEWTVGTLERAAYMAKKFEDEGFTVHVRKCGNPLNTEFIKAGLNYKGEPAIQ